MKLLENAIPGDAASVNLKKKAQVLCSGTFNGCTVSMFLEADGIDKALVYQFFEPGGVVIDAKKNTLLIAEISLGGEAVSIDVSVKQ